MIEQILGGFLLLGLPLVFVLAVLCNLEGN